MLARNRLTSSNHWLSDTLYLTAAIGFIYLLWLGSYPLFTPDEGRYSEVAREMVVSGDYITPRVNGVVFLDKPILYYWLQSVAIHLFGITEWALRLFPALFGILGCIITYICGRHLFDRRTGIVSAIILATAPLYFGGAHYADLNLEVAVLISCTLLFFITAIQSTGKTKTYFLFASYLFSAFAFLTKGLIGIAFPVMIAGTWIAILWRWDILKKIHLISGIVLFIAITLPWFVMVQRANPEFLHYFFVTQQVSRFLSSGEFNNKTAFWFYIPIILLGLLPWTIFLFQTFFVSIRHIWQARSQHQTELFLLIWVVVILVFFSVPHSKIVGYITPIFPALALLIGNYVSQRWLSLNKLFIVCSISSTIFLLAVVWNAERLNPNSAKSLALELKNTIQPQDEVITYFKFYQDIPIYLERRVTIVADWQSPTIATKDNWARELWLAMPFQDTHDFLIDENTFWQRWNSDKRVFVFLNDNYFEQFKRFATSYFVLGKKNDIILLSNKPTISN